MSWTRKLFVQGGSKNTEVTTSFSTEWSTFWNTNTTSNTDVATTRITSTVWSFNPEGLLSRNTTTAWNTNSTTAGTVTRNTSTNWTSTVTASTSWFDQRNTHTTYTQATYWVSNWVVSSDERNTNSSTRTSWPTFVRNSSRQTTTEWTTNSTNTVSYFYYVPVYQSVCSNVPITKTVQVPNTTCTNLSATVNRDVAGTETGCRTYNTGGQVIAEYTPVCAIDYASCVLSSEVTGYYHVMGFIQPGGAICAEDDRGLGECVLFTDSYISQHCFTCNNLCNTTYTSTWDTCNTSYTQVNTNTTTSSCSNQFIGANQINTWRHSTRIWQASGPKPTDYKVHTNTGSTTLTSWTTYWDNIASGSANRNTNVTQYYVTYWANPSNVRNTVKDVAESRNTSTAWSGTVPTQWSTNDTTSTSWDGEVSDSRNTSTGWNNNTTTSWSTQESQNTNVTTSRTTGWTTN